MGVKNYDDMTAVIAVLLGVIRHHLKMATLDTSFILKRAAAKRLEHVKTLNCWGSNLENVSNS